MKTNDSSLDANVDLFFQVGASRGKPEIIATFERAYQENRVNALRIAAWARDVRGGAGERGTFRLILSHLETNHMNDLAMMLPLVSVYGRWDDLLVLTTDTGRNMAFALIKEALMVKQDALCAKWMPRKGDDAVALRNYLGLTPKGYRKTLVTLTKVVETSMCAQEWTKINYSHVPSVAAARYQKAFGKHDEVGYAKYKADLVSGVAKINASAVYPYDVVKSMKAGDREVAKAQWEALPNYIGNALVLPMVDVSGSMSCPVGGNPNLTCMDVAVSLGLYLADKNTGAFKDMFLTFHSHSKLEVLRGDILSKLTQLSAADWGMSTNIIGAFKELLNVAVKNEVPEEGMPKYILILSDMEFDSCSKYDDSAIESINRQYMGAGYVRPNIIFWNLSAAAKRSPVTVKDDGTALISGFSPAIMAAVLAAKNVDPLSIMLSAINIERYQAIE